ncbi:phosphotransferase [Rhodococcoides yunnanense]|uniref:phosphotransferase n=1 Tax=Rhodococcoides yunnanense TaxID=278209 RepID=UPI001C3FC254|nr:phosphotransferase [Rhodococcus yunnanensis]
MFTRPTLLASPAAVIDAVEQLLGASVVREVPARMGFTLAIASWVEDAGGRQAFVKAAALGSGGGEGVRIGAELADVVGDLAPPLIAYCTVDGWAIALYDVIDGSALREWDDETVDAMADMSRTLRERLDPSPIGELESYAAAFAPLLGTWNALISPDHPSFETVAHLSDKQLPYGLDAVELAILESRWFDAPAVNSTSLQHGDIRRDNVIRDPSGRLWLVDWTHRWSSPGWVDMVRVAPDIAASGYDPERFFQTSAWRDAPPDGVDVVLAGLAGRAWRDGFLPAVPDIPHLRSMQRDQADATLRWLASRLER